MYEFSGASITKYHKLGGSHNRNLCLTVLEARSLSVAGLVPLESSKGKSILGFFPSFW